MNQRTVQRILFVTLSNLGDVVLTLPVFDALRALYPQARITVMTGPRPKEIFIDNPGVDNLIVFDKSAPLRVKVCLFFTLKKEGFDVVIDLKNSFFGAFLPARFRTSPFLVVPGGLRHMKERNLYRLRKALRIAELPSGIGRTFTFSEDDRRSMDEVLFERGVESAYGSRHADLADVTKFIGQVYMQRGDYAPAKHWLERAMQIMEYSAGPQSVPMADILMILAQCQGALRETAQPIANMQRSVEVFEAARGPQHTDVGMSLNLLAQIQRADGQLRAAQDNLQRAMVILEAAHGPDSPVLVVVLSTIGLTLTDLGEYVAAAEAFERGMRIYDSNAAMENNYGMLRALMGDGSGAIALYDRAQSIWEQDQGPDFPDIAFAVENKGIELARQGKLIHSPHLPNTGCTS